MAVLSLRFRSDKLKKPTNVNVVLPDPGRMINKSIKDYRVLYALHGVGEDSYSILEKTNIARRIVGRDTILVLPDGDRSMYQDDYLGQKYFSYLTEELPEYLSSVLGISREREKTWICGMSMGGYGAIRAALLKSENYQGFGSFSGLCDLRPLAVARLDEMKSDFPFFAPALTDMGNTPLNPVNLISSTSSSLKGYISTGTNDDLLICTQLFEKGAKEKNMDWEFSYHPGFGHTWDYWEEELVHFLDFMER